MIELINLQNRYWINEYKIKRLLKKLIEHYNLETPEVTLALVDNRTIKDLNRKFLKKNLPTDVLSFPMREKGPDGKFYLGDIIISAPQAFKQCFPKKHGLLTEIKYLTVHGFLHLLGFEHFKGLEEEEEKIKLLLLQGNNGN
ncbi:rRNA maturation RNase YbeY [Acidobacteriota bacterium]